MEAYDGVLALLVAYEEGEREFHSPPFDGMRAVVESHRPQTNREFDIANRSEGRGDPETLICAWCGMRGYPCDIVRALGDGLAATLHEDSPWPPWFL